MGFWVFYEGFELNEQALGWNVRKRLKTFENDWKLGVKRSKIFENLCEIFENIRKFWQFRSSAAGAFYQPKVTQINRDFCWPRKGIKEIRRRLRRFCSKSSGFSVHFFQGGLKSAFANPSPLRLPSSLKLRRTERRTGATPDRTQDRSFGGQETRPP